jgi:hypothetical protein
MFGKWCGLKSDFLRMNGKFFVKIFNISIVRKVVSKYISYYRMEFQRLVQQEEDDEENYLKLFSLSNRHFITKK